ncbi:hypothetical protein E3N88_39218 [Mikania micrantha]|uniref:Uncharacterized protein n=1 Tax=Mikania micrantha TaxID=192012 RepID=A0A5N6LWD5_9ASTR|nr:hypothetical protein E3N88_39218 [Mikania micrantha]
MVSREEVVAPSECSPRLPEILRKWCHTTRVTRVGMRGCGGCKSRSLPDKGCCRSSAEKWLPNLVLGLPIANTHTLDGVCSTGTGEGVEEAGDCIGLDEPEMMVAEGGRWCLASYFRLK